MLHPFFPSMIGTGSRLGRWACSAALLACLGLSGGCEKSSVRADAPPEDPLGSQCRQMRPSDNDGSATGFCPKSRQIEKDLGYQ